MSNALASASSPYLRQHADNPVDWLPWGEEAFARARREDKPVFLSIGYATCHWCHVMAHESFEDTDIAARLNADFICIKVDREERPDVDRVYMNYVQALTGHGGWPLSVFLTPELKPFFGGTYFPPEDRHGRSGFPTLLSSVVAAWTTRREELLSEGRRITSLLAAPRSPSQAPAQPDAPVSVSADPLEVLSRAWTRAWSVFNENFDASSGGFGGAPKFPQPSNLAFLLRFALAGDDAEARTEALRMVSHTLACMARGGIHDHVGGGFHRYSVDDSWFVPHFEKMLYDQAQLASLCLATLQATGDERHAWLARDILVYCLRDLRSPSGAFCSAEDADSPVDRSPGATQREGAFYVWRASELRELLPDADHALAVSMFSIQDAGNVPPGLDPHGELTDRNILRQSAPLAEIAAAAGLPPGAASAARSRILSTLALARGRRPRPLLDDKLLAAWNGLLLSALARASLCPSAAFSEPWSELPAPVFSTGPASPELPGRELCLRAALDLAAAVRSQLWDPSTRRLHRSWCAGARGPLGVASDYACLVQGLLDLYDATLDCSWLGFARELQALMEELFAAASSGGYFDSSSEAADLIFRVRDDHDGAEPAASGVAALNLFRLSALLDEPALRTRALQVLDSLLPQFLQAPHAHTNALLALEWAVAWPPRSLVLASAADDPRLRRALGALARDPGPPTIVRGVGPSGFGASLCASQPWLAEIAARTAPGDLLLYSCSDGSCSAPVAPALL